MRRLSGHFREMTAADYATATNYARGRPSSPALLFRAFGRPAHEGCEKFKRSTASGDFLRVSTNNTAVAIDHVFSLSAPPPRAGLIPETRRGAKKTAAGLFVHSFFLSFSLSSVLSSFFGSFLSARSARGCDGDESAGGWPASVVTSANPIVDNLRLIVPVTQGGHTRGGPGAGGARTLSCARRTRGCFICQRDATRKPHPERYDTTEEVTVAVRHALIFPDRRDLEVLLGSLPERNQIGSQCAGVRMNGRRCRVHRRLRIRGARSS